ncbi:hypothetical protein SS50377_26558 [Spironucleus salmonicida]|uniref:Uncharacterized protein n=1 Tax=Spironucleus salmonicida TaxID=348837 RepID=V6LAH3_9EUKA|nr:hypothetical protein SS50377_26558 [Spironucleus salmonicida]|eukprot:EST41412.1 Hypothetical protein SS50377_19129 [Spironucleus salmonicida]
MFTVFHIQNYVHIITQKYSITCCLRSCQWRQTGTRCARSRAGPRRRGGSARRCRSTWYAPTTYASCASTTPPSRASAWNDHFVYSPLRNGLTQENRPGREEEAGAGGQDTDTAGPEVAAQGAKGRQARGAEGGQEGRPRRMNARAR